MHSDPMSRVRRWLTMAILGSAGGFIYLLPFMHEVYYLPLQRALGFTGTQLGVMIASYGLVSAVIYLPGGWLADRISPRLLTTVALITTGLAGFYLATWPPFPIAVAIFAIWGVTTTGGFWGAMIRATREWGPASEQARAFGILEASRGASEAAAGVFFLGLFAWLGGSGASLGQVVMWYSIINVALGVAAWFGLKHPGSVRAEARHAPTWADLRKLISMPQLWLISIVVFTAYCAYWGTYVFTPYATEVFALSVVIGGVIGAGKNWFKPVVAGSVGFLADRMGVSRAVAGAFLILILCFGGLASIPHGSGALVVLMLTAMVCAFVGVFALRGIYFALLEEVRIPLALTGTATGIISTVAYTPDFFMPLMTGMLRDRFPGAMAYQIQFGVITGGCVLGMSAAILIYLRFGRTWKAAAPVRSAEVAGSA